MKYVISRGLAFACLVLTIAWPSLADDFKSKILREAAERNGYQLPSEVNQKFDPNKSALGKVFFESTELSFNSNTSCSSCHLDEFASADGLPIALGVGGHGKGIERIKNGGAVVPRNTLPLWGRASKDFNTFFWDGKVQGKDGKLISQFGDTLPSQDPLAVAVSLPFLEIREMVSDDKYVQEKLLTETTNSGEVIQKELVNRTITILKKGAAISEAYQIAPDEITFSHIAESITHFFADKFRIKDSKFSIFMAGKSSLTQEEIDGGLIFYGKGQCASCHSGPHFSDFKFHTVVTPQFGFGKNGFGVDYGRFNTTFNSSDIHKFRTPPLHNVAKTSPYGHSGSLAQLSEIITAHYDPLAFIDTKIMDTVARREIFDRLRNVEAQSPIPAPLTDSELRNLEAFLLTLSF